MVLNRVTGPSLCPQKYWYVVTKQFCGVSASVFANNEIFRRFPAEIKNVATKELQSTTNFPINKQPRTFVTTTFGLFAALLRQKELSHDGFIGSSHFSRVFSAINDIELKQDGAKTFGGNFEDPNLKMQHLQVQVKQLQEEIEFVKAKNCNHERNCSLDSNDSYFSLPSSPSTMSSSPTSISSSPSSMSSTSPSSTTSSQTIEDTKSGSFGSTTKKRKIASLCQNVLEDVQDVCNQRNESMACVLGNGFVFGGEMEKEYVRNTISDTIDVVMNASGPKKGFCQLLTGETLKRIHDTMRVPDWVLLLFKLEAKLPDAAWQTMLNLTHLGRSGVCTIYSWKKHS